MAEFIKNTNPVTGEEQYPITSPDAVIDSNGNTLTDLLPLHGKTVLMLGDSLTQLPITGSITTGDGIVEYFARMTGATTIRGAFGGGHLSRRTSYEPSSPIQSLGDAKACLDVVSIVKAMIEGDWTLQEEAAQYEGVDTACMQIVETLANLNMNSIDVITIFVGTNDFNGGTEIDGTGLNSIKGAVDYIIPAINAAYPHIKLYIFTPIMRKIDSGGLPDWSDESTWSDVWTNSKGYKLPDYCHAIIKYVSQYHIQVCDLYNGLGWNKYNYHNFCNDNDGTHPKKGWNVIAAKMASFIAAQSNDAEDKTKVSKSPNIIEGNLLTLNADGNLADSGKSPSSFASAATEEMVLMAIAVQPKYIYINTSGKLNIGNASTGSATFKNNTTIKKLLTIGTGVTTMNELCRYATNLTECTADYWDVASVVNVSNAFTGCTALTNMGNIGNWQFSSSLTSLANLFNGCNNLTEIGDVKNWDTSNITDISYMFYNCSELRTFGDMSQWDTSNITTMNRMCMGCTNLDNIGLPPIPSGCSTSLMYNSMSGLKNVIACGEICTTVALDRSWLTAASTLKVLNALSETPDTGATITFRSGIYSEYSAEDKLLIDAARTTAENNGWTIVNMS